MSDLVDPYTTLDVCRATGCTYRQLDYWVRTGMVTPSVNAPHGSGSRRLFSAADVAGVQAIVDAKRTIEAVITRIVNVDVFADAVRKHERDRVYDHLREKFPPVVSR